MIIDSSDKENRKKFQIAKFTEGWEIDYEDSYVFVSNLSGGMSIIDTEDKSNPKPSFNIKTRGSSYDIAVSIYGYLVDGFSGLVIIELKNRMSGQNQKTASKSVIHILGDNLGSEEIPVFQVNNPVYFSARDSFDPEGEDIEIKWDINAENSRKDSFSIVEDDSGEKIGSYSKGRQLFGQPGNRRRQEY